MGRAAAASARIHRRTLCLGGAGGARPAGADISIVRADSCGSAATALRGGAHGALAGRGHGRHRRRGARDRRRSRGLQRRRKGSPRSWPNARSGCRALQTRSEPVALGSLLVDAPAAVRGSLPAVIGVEAGEPFVVDLVADGPHAVVAGVTGSGKSELLITWILALCATHSTRDVSFLLADFKGGTAFDALAEVPARHRRHHRPGRRGCATGAWRACARRCAGGKPSSPVPEPATSSIHASSFRAWSSSSTSSPRSSASIPSCTRCSPMSRHGVAHWACTSCWERSDRPAWCARASWRTARCGSACG